MKPVTDAQVRKLMKEFQNSNGTGIAAMKAGMDRKTARKYRDAGKLPSQMVAPHNWRTRPDPLADSWDEVVELLRRSPGLSSPGRDRS